MNNILGMGSLSAKAVARDVFIVVALSAVAGLYTSLAMPEKIGTPEHASISQLLALVLVTIGFTIVACLSPNHRWRQLVIVGGITWILGGIFNMFFSDLSIIGWLKQAVHFAITLLIGGGFSYIFKGSKPSAI